MPEKEKRTGGLGLMNMQHRVQLTGGELLLDSEQGAGTRVTISVPLA
jgi:signal transduction histidine kinase